MPENISQNLVLAVCGGGVLLGMLILGLFLIGFSWRSRQMAQASQRWPQAPGQIVRTSVKESVSHDSDGRSITRYAPVVEYTYQIHQQTYRSQRVAFGAETAYGSVAKAEEALSHYPVGKLVAVFYDPRQPASSVLERRAGGTTASFVAGVFCIGLGLCLGCSFLAWGGAGLWLTGK